MADEFGERTEPATQRRREEAREQGQVAYSSDLASGLLLMTGVLLLYFTGPTLGATFLQNIRHGLAITCGYELDVKETQHLLGQLFLQGADLLGLFFAVLMGAGVGIGILQVGFHFLTDLVTFRWERIMPTWERVFSINGLVRGLTALLKVLLVATLAYVALGGRLGQITALSQGSLNSIIAQSWSITTRLLLMVAGGLLLLGVIDWAWTRFRYEQSLRMTREELKEEIKREEGDPQIKGRIRRLMREAAQQRMLREVPRATVVITNPTELAIALQYNRDMGAPKVLAKGSGLLAQRIVALARKNSVPIVERKPLARALFRTVQIGQEIPATLYLVVAELLAYVYRLRPVRRQVMSGE